MTDAEYQDEINRQHHKIIALQADAEFYKARNKELREFIIGLTQAMKEIRELRIDAQRVIHNLKDQIP